MKVKKNKRAERQELEGFIFISQILEPKGKKPLFVSFEKVKDEASYAFTKDVSKYFNIHKILIRDTSGLFYQNGIPSLAPGITNTINYLQDLIHALQPSKTVFFGELIGAYAAILFGTHVNADEVHAFSPITSIENRKQIPWKESFDEIHAKCSNEYFNLKRSLNSIAYSTLLKLYYDETYEFIIPFIENVQTCNEVETIPYSYGERNLVNKLRESGELDKILERAIESAN